MNQICKHRASFRRYEPNHETSLLDRFTEENIKDIVIKYKEYSYDELDDENKKDVDLRFPYKCECKT